MRVDDIDDVLMISLHRLWQNRSKFSAARGTARAWFRQIAVNVARYQLKKACYREALMDPALLDAFAPGPISARDGSSDRRNPAAARSIREALAGLSAAQRRIILADTGSSERGASQKLAQELGLRPGTVRAYRARAWARLRRVCRSESCAEPAQGPDGAQRTRVLDYEVVS